MTRRAWLLLGLVIAIPLAAWAVRRDPWAGRYDLPGAKRVLFVGNSQTFVNDVPGLVARLVHAGGDPPLGYLTTAGPGMYLSDHLARGTFAPALAERPWDVVVLQEQSLRSAVQPLEYVVAAQTMTTAVRERGGEPLLVEFWGYGDGSEALAGAGFATSEDMRTRIRWNVASVEAATRARTIPVGAVVSELRRTRPDLELWQSDGVHASLLGSYTSACVHYAVIYGEPVSGNPFDAGLPDAPAVQATVDRVLATRP